MLLPPPGGRDASEAARRLDAFGSRRHLLPGRNRMPRYIEISGAQQGGQEQPQEIVLSPGSWEFALILDPYSFLRGFGLESQLLGNSCTTPQGFLMFVRTHSELLNVVNSAASQAATAT